MHSARPTTTFCLPPHSTLTVLQNEYKPICFHHCQFSPSPSPPAVYFNCPSTTNFKRHTKKLPSVHVLTNASDNLSFHSNSNARHTIRNSLASLLRQQQKSTSKIQTCLHSTSALPLVQLSFRVKHTDASSHKPNSQQQRSPLHTQTYLPLSFSHPHSLPLFLHFQFRSAVATSYQRISRLQLHHTSAFISLLILPTTITLSFLTLSPFLYLSRK